jgi:hypothetical protein
MCTPHNINLDASAAGPDVEDAGMLDALATEIRSAQCGAVSVANLLHDGIAPDRPDGLAVVLRWCKSTSMSPKPTGTAPKLTLQPSAQCTRGARRRLPGQVGARA